MAPCSGRGAVWLARLLWEQEVAGSNPVAPIFVNLAESSLCDTCRWSAARQMGPRNRARRLRLRRLDHATHGAFVDDAASCPLDRRKHVHPGIDHVCHVRKRRMGDIFWTRSPASPFRRRRRIGAARAMGILQPRSGDTNRGTRRRVDPSPPVTYTSFSHILCCPLRGCGLGCLLGPGAYAPGYCGSPLPGLESLIERSRNRRRSRGLIR